MGGIAFGAVVLVMGAILFRGFAENGFRLGSQLAWRYACLGVLRGAGGRAALPAGGALLSQSTPPESLGRKLIWGFCASYGVYLLSVFLPNVIRLSAGATLMVLFGGSVVLVMALTAAPLKRLGDKPVIPAKIRRVLLGTAAGLFLALLFPDGSGANLLAPTSRTPFMASACRLMVAGLLVRFADRWFSPDR